MNRFIYFIFMLLAIGFLVAKPFELVSKTSNSKALIFTTPDVETIEKDGFMRLTTSEKGSTSEDGMPELPIFTSYFQMDAGISYDVNYSVVSSHVIKDIQIYPYQGEPVIGVEKPFLKNINYYNSNTIYPENKLTVSEPMVMRDIEVGLISFIPYEYNAETQSLTIFDEVEINIVESGTRDLNTNLPIRRSKLFEPFYEDLIVDYEPLSTRDEYQPAAIMYICGGGSSSHPYVQELVEWRRKQGYIVYLISESEAGTSANSIKSFLQNVLTDFDDPPEIVGLIGDTSGSYSIPHFTYSGGATDVEYSYLSGNDFLPEIFIGRISVNSSSDISNIINKTLTYEKAVHHGNWWFERAALVGDPSDSGVSTITTMKYIQNIMENHGMNDIRTCYDCNSEDNWVENQFDDGILYYNYRGFYGSSGIGQSGLNSGMYTPFAASLTCGTGDYNGTSESERFIREGSLSDPQGAVASVGVSTLETHTAYNNIVHMGIYDGIFSKGMYHAGAALANGKISLYTTYPTNPNSAVSKFSSWPNLMGDPALHLWRDIPHDFVIDAPASLPAGVQSLDVTIYDENGNEVEDARVTLVLGDEYFTVYTDPLGDATITWSSNNAANASITAFKNGFRLAQTPLVIGQVEGAALYLDQTRTVIDDTLYGDGNFQLNSGETISLTMPILNYGSEDAVDLDIELISENINVQFDDSTIGMDLISAGSSEDVVFHFSVAPATYEGEELDLKLNISDNNGEVWNISVPSHVYGPKLELSGYELVEHTNLEPGVESTIDILFHNSGTRDIENLVVELDESNDFVQIIENNYSSIDIHAGEQIILSSIRVKPVSHMINGSTISLKYSYTSNDDFSGEDYMTMSVGNRDEDDPMGPDEYGYYIYDSGDLTYPLVPVYDWIEITGGAGGQNFNFTDTGDGCYSSGGGWYGCNDLEGEDTQVLQLPFTFQFYGIEYNEITVSTNGWIAFGDREMSAFRNYSIPGAGGPSPMVAGFWDDLTTDNGGDVYYLVSDEHVIIQWDEMRIHEHGSQENTFQMILYNPGDPEHLTQTGDGEIKIQYKDFNNISDGDYNQYTPLHGCYSTIGIENHLGNVGLEYTFDNQYPTESMTLSDETAIFITTSLGFTYESGDVNQDDELNVLDIVTIVNFILGVLEPTAYQQYAGDLNEDETINVLDIVLIVNLILNN